ncbi:hypothetical protein R1sor_019349 [Riccia sorocarpa]|uniref:Staygreen protein domain-containing protein n=1 Tax=Riccia sorocarpa TaxID=122646 RepID=A0ABD3ICE3_9MARC
MAACVNGLSSSLSQTLNAGNSAECGSNYPSTSSSLPGYASRFRRAEATALAITTVLATRNGHHRGRKVMSGLGSSFWNQQSCGRLHRRTDGVRSRGIARPVVEARLFGPAIFEASKLCVLFLGVDQEKHPEQVPRSYTLTHSDITAEITLAVAKEINKAQLRGWYRRLQRDEVLAEWRKAKGQMSLHVHCHISGGHWLLNLIAKVRFYIFRKELPVVLEAFMHGDRALFEKHPDLARAPVWVYFHSNMAEYNRVENWGPLNEATKGYSRAAKKAIHHAVEDIGQKYPQPICPAPCNCCSRHRSLIPFHDSLNHGSQQLHPL